MIIVAYDFSNDRTRAKFSRFLDKYGRKVQYSIYEVRDSSRVLQNILNEVELVYRKKFTGADSILIFQVCAGDRGKIKRYGYAKNEEAEVVIFS
ncbi:MAG: CRISPR-associated endonuclease Cas2 [Candidatus Wildermuthbacteria bacterium RIFCSPHIGHO2_01_FULL_45_20]|uniref:CRISPR-associated endoribonuclease Cas2 n=1 Tax=Candidatus Wildermuthbacteria bacterium RIFCSPHIGHO2_02_FULL_45_25 TaxID=1802450 RepID=A0A1G2R4V4_9BACT|nr:MAG: CRISPR-associated endonuclease Cas2 [Candidatus Wildermuthbacteria bacterium RIFCSPHIGHO2_01_FULL_45_20]OHA67890.1 MAG: CRISPR-associated endonuclease Cas2 [Candidatus Wildermuthbacteria bacterium RIFCSPHIGHO2_02_FULL_45_25]